MLHNDTELTTTGEHLRRRAQNLNLLVKDVLAIDKSRAQKTINAGRGMGSLNCTQQDEVLYTVGERDTDLAPRQHHEYLAMDEAQDEEEEDAEIRESQNSSELQKLGLVKKL